MPKRRGKKSGLKRSVDMTGVETGFASVPDGYYVAVIAKAELKEGEDSGKEYYRWGLRIDRPAKKGVMLRSNTTLQPQGLFSLKALIEGAGGDVPDGVLDFDPADLYEEEIGLEIVNEKYEGRDRPQVARFMSPEDAEAEFNGAGGEEEEEEEEEAEVQVGSKVKFEDEDGKMLRGVVTAIVDDEITVDVKGEEWGLDPDEVQLVS